MSTGNAAPSSRRRFWIAVLCFALVNSAAWIVYNHHVRSAGHGLLRVEAFEPGNDAVTGRRPTVLWRFNTDVTPTAAYGKEPGAVSPAVAGKWAWENPRTLTFTPDGDLPEATRISFTLADTFLRGPMGSTLDSKYSSTIQVEPLTVDSLQQTAAEPNSCFVLSLIFNDRVFPSDVIRHLTVTDNHGVAIPCRLFGHPTDHTIHIETDPLGIGANGKPASDSLHVRLSPGLTARGGNLVMAEPYLGNLELSRNLTATELTAEAPFTDAPFLRLGFNGHVAQSALQQIVRVDPKIDFALQPCGDSQYFLIGDFKPQTRYTVTLAGNPPGTDPAEYPMPGHLSAFVPDRQSGVWLDSDQGYLSSAGNRTLLAHTVNVDAVRVTVTRVYDNNLVEWQNARGSYSWRSVDDYGKPLAEKSIPLPREKNVQHDARISLDELLPPDCPRDGVYRVELSSDAPLAYNAGYQELYEMPRQHSYAVVTLSDIGLTAKQVRSGVVVWATSIRSDQPLANIHIRVYSNKNQPLGEATTDATGLARIDNIHPAEGESLSVILADRVPPAPTGILGPTAPSTNPAPLPSSDTTWLALRGSNWELGDVPTGGKSYLRTGYDAFLYTDRGVYRPGETVHLRAILRDPHQHAPGEKGGEGGFPVRWQLRRPDDRNWQSQIVMLDADGAASFDAKLLADLPTGQWTATLSLPGDDKGDRPLGSVTFNIEEFVPARMKVKLSFDAGNRASLSAGSIAAQIQADYLFGRPAAGLTTELATHVEPVAFDPPGWSGWAFGDTAHVRSSPVPNLVRHNGKKWADNYVDNRPTPTEVKLDSAGHYAWSIEAAAAIGIDPGINIGATDAYAGPWRLTASAGVREAGGRAVTAVQHIDIDALPAYLALRRGEAGGDGDATPGSPCPIHIRLVRPDAQQAGSADTIAVSLSRATWNCTLVWRNGRYQFDSTRMLDPIRSEKVDLTAGKADWSPTIPSDGEFIVTARDTATGAYTSLYLTLRVLRHC